MRMLLVSALAVASAALMGAAPASASRNCDGAACSSTYSKTTYKSHRKASRSARGHRVAYGSRKARHASSRKHQGRYASRRHQGRYASVRRTKRSYSGGSHSLSGMASYYWQPQALASGGRFNPNALTAAHKTLPFGTKVRVTNLNNGRSVTVTINDRGPYIRGRIIDLSRRAAGVIGMTGAGVARVAVNVVGG